MKKIILITIILIFTFLFAGNNYKVDASHSSVDFSVKHLAISKVKGTINDFDGKFSISKKGLENIELSAKVKSVDTNNKKRDAHLQNADFFEIDSYPDAKINFKKYKGKARKGKLYANVTIKDVTKEVVFDVNISEEVTHPFQKDTKVVAISLSTTIDRLDFNIGSGKKYSSRAVIGHKINLEIAIEGTRQI